MPSCWDCSSALFSLAPGQESGTGPAPGSSAECTRQYVPLPCFPPCTLEAFLRTLKWPLKVPPAAAQEWLEGQAESSVLPNRSPGAWPGFGSNGFY